MTNSTLPLPPPPHLLLSNPFLASFAASCLLQNIDLATATLPPSSPLLLPKKTHTINSFNMPTCCACSHDNCQILSSFLSFPPPHLVLVGWEIRLICVFVFVLVDFKCWLFSLASYFRGLYFQTDIDSQKHSVTTRRVSPIIMFEHVTWDSQESSSGSGRMIPDVWWSSVDIGFGHMSVNPGYHVWWSSEKTWWKLTQTSSLSPVRFVSYQLALESRATGRNQSDSRMLFGRTIHSHKLVKNQ